MGKIAQVQTTGTERFFRPEEIIVSKTDLKGRLLYANRVFISISGYTEGELLGQPHSILRHPDMPRCVFKLLWDTIQNGEEIFAYVINRCKNGDHYWVLAHVTPSFDEQHNVIGYHSNRRVPNPETIKSVVEPLYAQLMIEEDKHNNAKDGMNSGFNTLNDILASKGVSYEKFIFSLQG